MSAEVGTPTHVVPEGTRRRQNPTHGALDGADVHRGDNKRAVLAALAVGFAVAAPFLPACGADVSVDPSETEAPPVEDAGAPLPEECHVEDWVNPPFIIEYSTEYGPNGEYPPPWWVPHDATLAACDTYLNQFAEHATCAEYLSEPVLNCTIDGVETNYKCSEVTNESSVQYATFEDAVFWSSNMSCDIDVPKKL